MIHGYENFRKLVDLLAKRTDEDKIDWSLNKPTKTVTAWLGDKTISLRKSKNTNDEELYVFSLSNSGGDVLQSFDDEDITRTGDRDDPDRNYYNKSDQLYEKIVRKISGADAALEKVLRDLESGVDFTDIPF